MTTPVTSLFFFFNDTATTEIYTLSLHDALPISHRRQPGRRSAPAPGPDVARPARLQPPQAAAEHRRQADRKSTRLNSSHLVISYAVFCLKKKKLKHLSTRHGSESQDGMLARQHL